MFGGAFMPRLVALLVLLTLAGVAHGMDLGHFSHGPRAADLFKAQSEQPAKSEDPVRDMMEKSKWRNFSGEVWGGIVATSSPRLKAAWGLLSKCRAASQSRFAWRILTLGDPRDYRPASRPV